MSRSSGKLSNTRLTPAHSFAGYAPCLAACKHLHKAGLLGADVPGKVAAPPGNAFELVYAKVRL